MADWNDFNNQLIAEFRANDGVVGGKFAGTPLLILTTTGARSGQPRLAPLAFDRDGDALVIIASKGGAPTNPDWYHNIKANPVVTVEVGTETFQAVATEVTGNERERLFDQVVAKMPGFGDYQKNTSRRIPVVTLTRSG